MIYLHTNVKSLSIVNVMQLHERNLKLQVSYECFAVESLPKPYSTLVSLNMKRLISSSSEAS